MTLVQYRENTIMQSEGEHTTVNVLKYRARDRLTVNVHVYQ